MATYYLDLDITGSGTGTTSDPFTSDQFLSNLSDGTLSNGDSIYIKGSHDFGSETVTLAATCTYDRWDTRFDNGIDAPWRIKANVINLQYADTLKNGILYQAGSNGSIEGELINCYIITDGSLYWGGDNDVKGCLVNASGGSLLEGFSSYVSVIDTIIVGSISSPSNYINCAFTDSSSGGSDTDCQFNWSAPSMPAWDADQSSFQADILSAGITTPPQPGNSPYSGYETGLWGESRTGIGAMSFGVADSTAPNFSSGPSLVKAREVTADFTGTINESGTIYMSVYSASDGAPDVSGVIAGSGVFASSYTTASGSAVSMTASGLTDGTTYTAYFATSDASSNTSGVWDIDFTTETTYRPSYNKGGSRRRRQRQNRRFTSSITSIQTRARQAISKYLIDQYYKVRNIRFR